MIAKTNNSFLQNRTTLQFGRYGSMTQIGLALAAGVPLLLSFLIPIDRLGHLECLFLNTTSLPCPFCGFTRSIWAISDGDWVYATLNCPLAWLLYAIFIAVLAVNVGCMLSGAKTFQLRIMRFSSAQMKRATGISIALVLLNWIYRLTANLS